MSPIPNAISQIAFSENWLQPIRGALPAVPCIGLEMEIFAFDAKTHFPFGFPGQSSLGPATLFQRLAALIPDAKLYQDDLGVTSRLNLATGGSFSIEPGGQIEYSSAPATTFCHLVRDVHQGLHYLEEASGGQLVFLSHGTNPIAPVDLPLILPKSRYQVMTRYFASEKQGRGLDMMRHCATVQANIDLCTPESWDDAVNLSYQLVPFSSALFANSLFSKGKRSQFPSERQDVWENMDKTRTGVPEGVPFAKNIVEAYAAWGLRANVLYREHLPFEKQPLFGEMTFLQWMQQKENTPTLEDWKLHLSTLFPHVRLRNFLEIRNIDAQPFQHTLAPVVYLSSVLQNRECAQETREFIGKNPDPFSLATQTALLDIALHSLAKDTIAVSSLRSFRNYLLGEKQQDAQILSAAEFFQEKKTSYPADLFMEFL